MKVQVVPLTDFIHDDANFRDGVESKPIPLPMAEEFERRGLVRIVSRRVDRALTMRGAAAILGKAPAAGPDPLSSASPAAPALQQTITRTLSSLAPGVRIPPKKARGGSSS